MRNPFIEILEDGDTDIELVRRAQDGDHAALERLGSITSQCVWLLCRRMPRR
jgi:hypothetical protein